MIKLEELEPFPAGSNPFQHDAFHMGAKIAQNCTVMFPTHEHQRTAFIIVCNTETGERVRLRFSDDFGRFVILPKEGEHHTP